MTSLLLAALVTFSAPATADPGSLAGVKQVRVKVSPPSLDALPCGLDMKALLTALSERLQSGGFIPSGDGAVTVTVSMMTHLEEGGDRCGTATMLGAYREVSYFDEEAGQLRSGHVVLWQRGTMALSRTADHPDVVLEEVRRLGDSLLETWQTENPSTSG